MTEWATARAMAVCEVVTEVGSGMTGGRGKLSRLLADPTATTIIVEHPERLAGFGVEQLLFCIINSCTLPHHRIRMAYGAIDGSGDVG